MRLVDYAKAHLVVVPIDAIGALIAAGSVTIDGRVGRIDSRVDATATVEVEHAALKRILVPEPIPLAIVHEDDDLIVCDKPAGMHVHPLGLHRDGTLLGALLWHCGARPDQPWGRWRPHPLHRLDRAASGLIAIGKRAAVHEQVRQRFAEHAIERRYRAVVHGCVAGETGTIDAPLGRDPTCDYRRAVVPGGQRAVTHWQVLERERDRTWLELTLETGRTHQIRAHLASIGHPIVGDTLYATGRNAAAVISLHAALLRMRHPRTGKPVTWTSANKVQRLDV
ncbi:MAG TPA: RluA family pseudouridine synthase [Kofleriaceae bacterium]|nr:RluA family pseudouridine synthase [Kofleriaceae bacterium]